MRYLVASLLCVFTLSITAQVGCIDFNACNYDSNKHSIISYFTIELKTYLTDEVTLISDCIDLTNLRIR